MVTSECEPPSVHPPVINVTPEPDPVSYNDPLPLFCACLFRRGSSVEKSRQRRGGKYDGRTEGRDGHVMQTSLTVELA